MHRRVDSPRHGFPKCPPAGRVEVLGVEGVILFVEPTLAVRAAAPVSDDTAANAVVQS